MGRVILLLSVLCISIYVFFPSQVGDIVEEGTKISIDLVEETESAAISDRKNRIRVLDSNTRDLDLSFVKGAADGQENSHLLELLSQGADVNGRGADSSTALIMAARNGRSRIVKMLLEYGAHVDAKDTRGETALIHAAGNGDLKVATILLEANANINLQSKIGNTALLQASRNGSLELVQSLVFAGADTNLNSIDGWTALKIAESRGYTDIVELLRSAGAIR